MERKELIQTPEYWKTLYENECERLGIKPRLIFIDPEQIDKTKLETKCLAEDVENGNMKKDLSHFLPHDEQSWIQGYGFGFLRALKVIFTNN